ncbi:uncharacterized protein [Diadema setosum]|uniref:uncharacterized protein n=1 Tax=Diadema setosum TaxID=31175 RepID=UPI003B3BA292
MDAVKSYCEAKYSAVPNGKPMETATDPEKPEQVFQQLKKKLRQTPAMEYLSYLLVSSYGYLIPNTEQRQKLGVVDDNFNGEKGIPGPVLAVWTPVLYYLCSTINLDLAPVLVNSIVEKLNTLAKRQGPESEDAVFISYLKGWAKELIKREQSPAEENDGPEKRGEKFRRGKRLWKTAVKTCLQRPHEQTEAIFKSLLPLATDSCVNGSGQELVNLFTLMARGPNGSTLLQSSANRLGIERLLEAQSPTYRNGQSAEPPVLEEREGLEPWSVSTASTA